MIAFCCQDAELCPGSAAKKVKRAFGLHLDLVLAVGGGDMMRQGEMRDISGINRCFFNVKWKQTYYINQL